MHARLNNLLSFFVIKNLAQKSKKVCKYKWEDILSKWLKGVCLTAKYMEGVCKYFVNKTETPSFFAVFKAI